MVHHEAAEWPIIMGPSSWTKIPAPSTGGLIISARTPLWNGFSDVHWNGFSDVQGGVLELVSRMLWEGHGFKLCRQKWFWEGHGFKLCRQKWFWEGRGLSRAARTYEKRG